jgi:hypothetical protein
LILQLWRKEREKVRGKVALKAWRAPAEPDSHWKDESRRQGGLPPISPLSKALSAVRDAGFEPATSCL